MRAQKAAFSQASTITRPGVTKSSMVAALYGVFLAFVHIAASMIWMR